MSVYLNNTEIIWKNIVKPCKLTGYCPYGPLVEEFPLGEGKEKCEVFHHHCPAFYHAEPLGEEGEASEEEIKKMIMEFSEAFDVEF
ncbi:MAG: hypothetical protein Q8M92_02600 [Candidatus Subteraquimicrobiales bacterium]|nr:hypothetical protein [Candidatus Subteraquimicrobiales bacterium]